MKEGRAPGCGAEATPGSCPEFELLSRLADEELEAEEARGLTSHVERCGQCADLLATLRSGLGTAGVTHEGVVAAPGCVGDETLLAYLTEALPADERRGLKTHLASCDACVSGLSRLHRRLAVLDTVEATVPAALKAKASAAIGSAAPGAKVRRLPSRGAGRRAERRVPSWLRLPVLMPVSIAAGALLMVSIQEAGIMSPAQHALTRAVQRDERMRVTSAAEVRAEPRRQAQVITVVARGTTLQIEGEERDWLLVKLADERTGWVERDAFE